MTQDVAIPSFDRQDGRLTRERHNAKPGQPLSHRESQILTLVGKGFSNQESARLLGISTSTVVDYLRAIYRKLDVSNRVEAAVWAERAGML